MQFKRLFAGLVIGLSVVGVGVGCTQQRDFQADAQTNPATTQPPQSPAPARSPDVPYVPTPQAVVDRMLQIANVNSNDVVYDLGSGDGRIPITAVRQFNVKRAIGVDINPQRVQEANQNAQQANVTDRVEFREQDLFETDFREATVVTLYLLPEVNLRLRPKLLSELKPGTRIVSHAFDMGDWKPERVENVDGRVIYYWTVPENVPANLKE
ncbi:SAM-dependent methyltransferase [Leptolyngbya sp. GGD]|uniref:SAM-dependent methyltransferase n=1 Tax=Leptolyngbya sp. GGD TaxID=2997907 RepID=UPI00227AAA4E|nr:class I SAM-dependent methyltransferase [Leptolyngbya sp. GGD]MCY6494025.1 class I SAM-dependent methyltransferase [Leptolyngbya sp. GGD]